MPKKLRKRIYRMSALNGDYISIYLWNKAPEWVLSRKDIIEISIKNKKNKEPHSLFVRPDEAENISAGLFLALLNLIDKKI